MAITTYAELQSAVADFQNRDDLTSVIPTFISLAEAQMQRVIRHHKMMNRAEAEIENRFGRRAALQYANELLSGGKITGQMIEAARRANAPSWMLAALAPTAGLLNMETEGSE